MDNDVSEAIPTNMRLLLVLEEVSRLGRPVTPTEVNHALKLPKPTIHRLWATLEEEGFLLREADGRYSVPGPRFTSLAIGVLSSQSVSAPRHAILSALAQEIGETCNITVPDGTEMVYLDRVETKWPLRIQLPVGTRVPLHCTAAGKLYLSSLPEKQLDAMLRNCVFERRTERTLTDGDALRAEIACIADQGYSFDNEEFLDGMICFAVPITDGQGRMVSTVGFHGPLLRLTEGKGKEWLPRLRHAANDLSTLFS